MELPPPVGLITLLTDFGVRDPYVGIMKGMIKRQFARAEVIDLCHDVPPQDVAVGALFLGAAMQRFPVGAVHVAVVDPGVGTVRRVAVACAAGCYWVAPDNGLLTEVVAGTADSEVRTADLPALGLRPESATFNGRDVFAPLGAMLASGRFGFRAVGPRARDAVMLDPAIVFGTRVVAVDHFGNLITGVRARDVAARRVRAVEIAGRRVPVHRTYADVEPGEPLALINSYDLLEIAVRDGNAAALLGASRGAEIALLEGVQR